MRHKNRNTRNVLLFSIFTLVNYTTNAQISVYDCAVPLNVENADINPSPIYLYEAPCIEFEEAINFSHPTGANKDFKASKQISVRKNFRVGNNGSNQFRLRIEDSILDVVAFDVNSLSGIPKFDKLEFGIEIPTSIQTAIESFIADEASTGALNPFMEWDIKVEATFTHSTSGTTLIKHGFYFEEYERIVYDETVTHTSPEDGSHLIIGVDGKVTHDGYREWGGRWDEIPTGHAFRIRFAPSELGIWDCSIKLIIEEGAQIINYPPFRFNVVPSDNKGFVEIGDNNRFFKRGDETFIPLGPNLGWPATEPGLDPADCALLGGAGKNEKYRNHTAPLKSFLNFEQRILELGASGANNFRYLMTPWAGDIEFERIGNYASRMHIAWEMDSMISLANSVDLNIDFNMLVHYPLEYGPFGIRSWDWADSTEYVHKELADSILILGSYKYFYNILPSITDGNDLYPYCYSTLPGVDVPEDFLINANAVKYYKQRLRYIIARWGYATNITNWELVSEIDHVGDGKNFRGSPYKGELAEILIWDFPPEFEVSLTGSEVQQNVEDWHQTMSSYIKVQLGDPHIISPSYAGHVGTNDDTYNLPAIDIKSENLYDFDRRPDFSYTITNPEIDTVYYGGGLTRLEAGSLVPKPVIFSEHGTMAGVFKCDDGLEFKRNLWMKTFIGTAMANDWNVWLTPEYWGAFGKVNTFLGAENFDSENWQPGHAIGGWSKMESADGKADMTYLRSSDGHNAMGVISNRTNNFHTQWTGPLSPDDIICDELDASVIWQHKAEIFDSFSTLTASSSKLFVTMPTGVYNVNFYNPEDNLPIGTTVIQTSPNAAVGLELDYPILDFSRPFIAFKIERNLNPKSSGYQEMQNLKENGVTLYPNPTEGITDFLIRDFDPNNPNYKLEIFDLMGKKIGGAEINGSTTSLKLSDQPSGVYLVQFTNGEKQITLRLAKK